MTITVATGTPSPDVELPMAATGAISGRIYDSEGQPWGNLLVQAMKAAYPQGQRELTAVQSVTTNDLGEYRFFWLPPGRYFISAIPPQAEPANFGMFRMGGFGMTVSNGVDNFLFFSSANTDPALSENLEREFDSQPADRYVPVYFPGVMDEQIPFPICALIDFGVGQHRHACCERHRRNFDGTSGKPPQYASLNMVDDVLPHPAANRASEPDTGAFDITSSGNAHADSCPMPAQGMP
jgi:hypothetical protein